VSSIKICKSFDDLTNSELYSILQARNEIFIVEQNCVYQDMDGYDQKSFHIIIPYQEKLGAYCRINPAGLKYPEWSIGRVLTLKHARNKKLGHELIAVALQEISARGGKKVRISAQAYLQKFYESHGFLRIGEEYLEDKIPHIEMLLAFPKKVSSTRRSKSITK
jgi:ElaA protein